MRPIPCITGLIAGAALLSAALPAAAQSFFFSTGNVTSLIATGSRPESPGKIEIESADDFVTPSTTVITQSTFTGLLTGASPTIGQVVVEMYRVFPKDSDTNRTPNVNTRANSPSDVAFDTRDTGAGNLTFTTNILNANFTAANSVLNGINPKPNQTTNGEGPVTGTEVQFNINFTTPFILPADHFFFVPQVQVTGGEFMWLSGTRPIVSPGTPFPPGTTDLQSWIRNANLDPDWSRIGTDIVGGSPAPTFNGAFSLAGISAPEPGSLGLLTMGVIPMTLRIFRRRARHRV